MPKYLSLLVLFLFSLTPVPAQRRARPVAALNSEYNELMPVISPDGKLLYLVRAEHPDNVGGESAGQDIWVSRRSSPDAAWSTPRPLGPPLNNIYNNAVARVRPDGKGLWLSNLYLDKNKTGPGLSLSTQSGKGWSRPRNLRIRNFMPRAGFVSFFPATDSILFISMETDSLRQEDLFISRRIGAEEWSAPENLGAVLNTAGFEIGPFLAPDGRSLYFASDGRGGFGDADIFVSRRLDDTWRHWSEPVNLGKEVNSPGFDAYFVLDGQGGNAYFTSEDGEQPDTDIYMIRQRNLPLLVAPTPATVRVPAPVPPDANLPQPGGRPLELVYFETNSFALNQAAETLLTRLAGEAAREPAQRFLLRGHTDDTGREKRNQELADLRARAVAAFLTGKGMATNRIRVESFGSSQPLPTGEAAADRAKNRRVEILRE